MKRAGQLVGDVGIVARLAHDDRLAEAAPRLFHPLKFMLASPAEDAAEILGRLGPTVWVEDKYDGIRAQLHRRGTEVRLYSRDLNEIGDGYPEVVAGAVDLAWDGILDGELLAFRGDGQGGGTVLPFLALQARIGRKRPGADILASVPVIFVAWDALVLGPRDGELEALLERPAGGAPGAARGARPAARRRRRRLRPVPPHDRSARSTSSRPSSPPRGPAATRA